LEKTYNVHLQNGKKLGSGTDGDQPKPSNRVEEGGEGEIIDFKR
jgi:hypothetical protein